VSIQTLIRNVGGTIETYFLDRQVASCTVSLYTGAGAKKVDTAAATVDDVSTALAAGVEAEDLEVTVSDSTGIVVGRRYLIGGPNEADPREVITVKGVSDSDVVTPWAPLMFDHALGATLKGIRVSYSVSSSVCDALWWDGWADFVPATGDRNTETVDCTLRKIPDNLIDESDIRLVWPTAPKVLDAELDLPAALREARDEFLIDFGGKNRAHTALGADVYRRPAALKFWLLRRHALGSDWKETMDGLQAEYETALIKRIEQVPVDADQDGATNGLNDGGVTMIELSRS